MAGGRRNRRGRFNSRRMDEEDLWVAFADRRGVRPTIHWKALWDLTAAMVARSVARRLEVDGCLFVSITINQLTELLFAGRRGAGRHRDGGGRQTSSRPWKHHGLPSPPRQPYQPPPHPHVRVRGAEVWHGVRTEHFGQFISAIYQNSKLTGRFAFQTLKMPREQRALEDGSKLDDHQVDMQDSTSEKVGAKATGKRSLAEVPFPNTNRMEITMITSRRASSRTQSWIGSSRSPAPTTGWRPDSPEATR